MFFKTDLNTRADEIRDYIPVSVATSFDNVSPTIGTAETNYILPLLGQTLYDQVHAYYTDKETLPDGVTEGNKTKFDQLIVHIQRALINLTYYNGFEFLSVNIDDSGFHRQENDTKKSLFKYQEDALKEQFKTAGFDGLDTMLEYIETYPTVFLLFTASDAYTLRKNSIIPSTKIFNTYIDISNSRLVFLKLRRFITQTEDFEIRGAIGTTLFDLVKTEIVKDSPATEITTLLPYIRKALSHISMAKAFRSLGFQVRDKGVYFISQEISGNNSRAEKPVTDSNLEAIIKAENENGQYYLSLLKDFIADKPTDYPDAIDAPVSPFNRDNADKTTYWV